MLYVRIYPNNVMDVIGLDIHNFTRTVAEDGKLEIHTTYVSLPMILLKSPASQQGRWPTPYTPWLHVDMSTKSVSADDPVSG